MTSSAPPPPPELEPAPPPPPPPPRVHRPPPVPELLRPRHLPRHRARGGNVDVGWGERDGGREGGFNGRGREGDVGTWGYTAPMRPAPAWQLLHNVPEWKRAKESKKGTWRVSCPCECEVCIIFYPVFARRSRELRELCCAFANASCSVRHADSRILHEVRATFA